MFAFSFVLELLLASTPSAVLYSLHVRKLCASLLGYDMRKEKRDEYYCEFLRMVLEEETDRQTKKSK